jgi:putative hydrolase of the HAD superfamily
MPKIKAVVFDLDDTLFPERSFQESGFAFIAKKLKKLGYPITKKGILLIAEAYPTTTFNVLIDRYNLPYKVSELLGWYRNHPPTIRPYPGVKALLKMLHREYKLGLLTDYVHRTQANKIKALGLENAFDTIIYTDQIGAEKPATAGFRLLREQFRCRKHEIIYVGDNEQKDFIGANKTGFITVKCTKEGGVYYGKHMPQTHKAQYEISDLQEIIALLHAIQSS